MGGVAGRAETPPFLLPGSHFGAALVFWLVGSVALVWSAPWLVAGLFPLPGVVGATHLFTLGWITTSILGALYQFLPVALGTPIRSRRLAYATLVLYVPGLALFEAGLLGGGSGWVVVGASAFGAGLLVFVGNLAATLVRAKRRELTWWALVWAGFFLLATVVIGVVLATNLRWGYLGGGRFGTLGAHLHIAVFGWVLLVMIGVARHLMPMFLLSDGGRVGPSRLAVALVAGGVLGLTALHHLPALVGRWIPAVLIGAGAAAFLVQAMFFYRRRRRPALDPGLRLAAVGLVVLAAGLLLGPAALVRGLAAPRLATAYVAALVLGISLFVAAHYYKILPFLEWYHRFGPVAGKQPVPRVGELYGEQPAVLAGAALSVGAAGLVTAILAGAPVFARAAATLYAAGAALVVVQMIGISRRRPA